MEANRVFVQPRLVSSCGFLPLPPKSWSHNHLPPLPASVLLKVTQYRVSETVGFSSLTTVLLLDLVHLSSLLILLGPQEVPPRAPEHSLPASLIAKTRHACCSWCLRSYIMFCYILGTGDGYGKRLLLELMFQIRTKQKQERINCHGCSVKLKLALELRSVAREFKFCMQNRLPVGVIAECVCGGGWPGVALSYSLATVRPVLNVIHERLSLFRKWTTSKSRTHPLHTADSREAYHSTYSLHSGCPTFKHFKKK